MIVVDASAIIDLLLRPDLSDAVADRLFEPDEKLHAPELIDLEIIQVLRRHLRSGALDVARAEQALDDLSQLPLRRFAIAPLTPRIWQLRDVATAYDAAYLALAEALDAPLLTRDAHLAASSGHQADVELI